VAAWIKLNAGNSDRKIAGNENNSTGGYKLGIHSSNRVEMEIRNATNASTLTRDVAGGTLINANLWYHVVGVYEKGVAVRTYVNGTLDRELATSEAMGASSGPLVLGREPFSQSYWWFGLMDDVRVYNKALTAAEIQTVMRGDPSLAWDPQPKPGTVLDIRDADAATWSAGATAANHDVYFGQDKDAVKAADAASPLYRGRQTGTSLSLGNQVEFGGGDYFWRIDEVAADGTIAGKGTIWNFTVPAYLIVDSFETYTDDEGSRIYEFWIDGMTDGNSGSVVGNLESPFAERTIVNSGSQAMPLDFNNVNAPYYSEANLELSSVQNWTTDGVANLVVFVRGDFSRDGLYLTLTDSAGKSATVAHPNASSLLDTKYTEWKIPLSSFTGVSLSKVKNLSIGVGDRTSPKAGGSGRIYIDDIRLTQP
jgi:hypothetical protein